MAQFQSYISFFIVAGLAYTAGGVFFFNILPELALLAGVIVFIAGMLPEVDSGQNPASKELVGLLSAVVPLALLEFLPGLKAGGVSRVALVVIACYLVTKIIMTRLLKSYTTPMGIIHSIPAAILTFEVVYLLFFDLAKFERLYVSLGAFVGYASHLLMDAYGNVDVMGTLMGTAKKGAPVLKFGSPQSTVATVLMYSLVLFLGWHVAKDFYPGLQITTPVKY